MWEFFCFGMLLNHTYETNWRRTYNVSESVSDSRVESYLNSLIESVIENYDLTTPDVAEDVDVDVDSDVVGGVDFGSADSVILGDDSSVMFFFEVGNSDVVDKESLKVSFEVDDVEGEAGGVSYESEIEVEVSSQTRLPDEDEGFSAAEVGGYVWALNDLFGDVFDTVDDVTREEFDVVSTIQEL